MLRACVKKLAAKYAKHAKVKNLVDGIRGLCVYATNVWFFVKNIKPAVRYTNNEKKVLRFYFRVLCVFRGKICFMLFYTSCRI